MEIWKSIREYPDYEVSSLGRVRRIAPPKSAHARNRLPMPYILKPARNGSGYLTVVLYNEAGGRRLSVHRLVAAAFHGDQPSHRHEVAHNDGTRTNNAASNLRWATSAANKADKITHGTSNRGSRHGMALLTERDVAEIRAGYVRPTSRRDPAYGYGRKMATKYGVHEGTIWNVLRGKTWSHVG